MQFALVDGRRVEASPGLLGHCPACNHPMIAKCGDLRVPHWAHKGAAHCDPWWEMSAWHRNWQDRFPSDWREQVSYDATGERHFADVKAPDGRVIEFQHSALKPDERIAREAFYGPRMVWVVDGLARKRDRRSFLRAIEPKRGWENVRVAHTDDCALFRDWGGRLTSVFFDFGEQPEDVAAYGAAILWHLHPNAQGDVILTPVTVESFVERVCDARDFDRLPSPPKSHSSPLPAFERFSARQGRRREMFRRYLSR